MDLTPPQPLLPLSAPQQAAPNTNPGSDAELRATAEAFEAAFLAEMLKHSGINEVSSEFGGGYGEEAFSSLVTQEYAEILAESGGIGLAEQIFESLKQRTESE
ncbi:MAG: rod-binding protein [Pseudomonadota bacterium]